MIFFLSKINNEQVFLGNTSAVSGMQVALLGCSTSGGGRSWPRVVNDTLSSGRRRRAASSSPSVLTIRVPGSVSVVDVGHGDLSRPGS